MLHPVFDYKGTKKKINIRHLPIKILLNGTLVLWYFGTFCYFLCDNCR